MMCMGWPDRKAVWWAGMSEWPSVWPSVWPSEWPSGDREMGVRWCCGMWCTWASWCGCGCWAWGWMPTAAAVAAWCCRMACCTVVMEVAEGEAAGCWMWICCRAGGRGAGVRVATWAAAAAAAEGKVLTCLARSCCWMCCWAACCSLLYFSISSGVKVMGWLSRGASEESSSSSMPMSSSSRPGCEYPGYVCIGCCGGTWCCMSGRRDSSTGFGASCPGSAGYGCISIAGSRSNSWASGRACASGAGCCAASWTSAFCALSSACWAG
ncbi:hypothetical protein MATL_G00013330 [Megalops atlanticus]|uniref:Uncharacterized protein n=1 Tax=Megalops atlanticus TaxID=7932 RepID=A0A9D3QKC9_MEGAT|nr:hypothetical protein MATL_G00013330 [Megalops atlanticus]